MKKPFALLLIIVPIYLSVPAWAQQKVMSAGIFTGITTTYSWDEGILSDPRYKSRYDIKLAPIGFSYGIDSDKVGFMFSPTFMRSGQNFTVLNTLGGQEGTRRVTYDHINIPLALKIPMFDVAFVKVSFVTGGSVAWLVKGSEEISHDAAKFRFPPETYPYLPADYTIEYDGVLIPKKTDFPMAATKDFNQVQVFVFAGFHWDWDVTEDYRVFFDIRVHYGLFEPRTSDYRARTAAFENYYDFPGQRRDLIGLFSVGVCKYLELDDKKEDHKKRTKQSKKKFVPKRYPWPGPRNKKGPKS